MQYINYFILFIIYLNILFSSLIIIRILIGKLAQKHTSIKQYQITNWLVTLFCVYFYIFFPIIGLYCLRIYNMNKLLDLKIFYENIKILISLNIAEYFFCITFIINILLSITIIYKKLNNHLYNFYFYIKNHTQDRHKHFKFIFNYLNSYRDIDIITFYFIACINYFNRRFAYYKLNLTWEKNPNILSTEYDQKEKLFYDYCTKRPWYHLHVIFIKIIENKYYKFFILFSPIFIILYDCIFNDWVITHVYYYLLLYIPVMLFRRFTILLSTENNLIGALIWDILYKKEHCIYALPKDHYKLFQVYIANGIKTVDLGPPAVMDFDVSWFISRSAQFIYNYQDDLYYNGVDKSLKLLSGNKFVYEYTDYDSQKEMKEEWYLIAVKYAYHDYNGKYALIVSIN